MAGRGDGAEGSLRYAEAKALHLRTIERLRRAPIDDEAFAALTRLSWSEKTRFDIEAEAMRRVESGAYDAARELLDSEEYARAKRLFTIEAARLEGFVAAEARRIESEEKRVARRGIFFALLALAIGGADAMLLGLRLGRRLLRPIDRLTSVTSAVAAGRFGARVVVAGRDELAALATGMNAMLDKIAAPTSSRAPKGRSSPR
jgi:methyl-accepting chemotaxis protein